MKEIKKFLNKQRKRLSTLFLLLLFNLGLFAQPVQITGTVKDATSGDPLPGVNILIKGTSNGTITDFDGKYTLAVVAQNSILVFSFVGYTTQEIAASGKTVVDVSLNADLMKLDEVIVIAYGKAKKSDLTGSVASLTSDDFNKGAVSTPEQLMQGKVAGVQITSNSGEPGSGAVIRVRGASSIRSGQMPLYVIDGVPLDMQSTAPDGLSASGMGGAAASNPLTFINPEDIESITVLKDASASAIYGSRAANGVIIVTTKKGKEGNAQLTYSTYVSASKLPKKIDVLNAQNFVKYRVQLLDLSENDPSHYGYSTDWQDQVFRTGITQSHNVSVSAGTAKTSYNASFNYFDQQGIIKKTELQRYTGHINLAHKALKDRLTFEASLTASRINETKAPIGGVTGFEGDLLMNVLLANPTWPVKDSTGNYFQVNQENKRNPLAMIEYTDFKVMTDRLLSGVSANLEIIKGLNYKINFGVDHSIAVARINQSSELNYMKSTNGRANINNKELNRYLIEHTLSYSKVLGVHNFTALGGFSYQHQLVQGYNIGTQNYPSNDVLYTYNLQASQITLTSPSSYGNIDEMQSVFGRLNYTLMEKYLFTFNFRRDGSSKFGANKKYGNFPSGAFAWRLSEEPFIKNLNIFDNLKLRLGWGKTGNQEIGSKYSIFSLRSQNDAKAIIDGSSITQGYVLSRTPNPNVTWETTTSTDVGIDYGFFKGRLSGTIDYFNRKTTGMLMEVPSKQPAPTGSQMINVDGFVINNGLEVGINGTIFTSHDFSWEINLNFTTLHNIVKDLPVERIQTGRASGQGMTGVLVEVFTNDQPMFSFYGPKFMGYDSTGKSKYLKAKNKSDSLTILGSSLPNYLWSFNSTFRYKKFDFNFFINAVHGNLIYNNTANSVGVMGTLAQANNTFESTVKTGESKTDATRFSSRFLEDGSYIRLSNATIGYNISLKDKSLISNLRIYLTGANLFLITKYTGYDPDVNTPADSGGYGSNGIDNANYPKARTFLLGLNVTF